MQINLNLTAFQPTRARGCHHAHSQVAQGVANGLLQFASQMGRYDRLGVHWGELAQPLRGAQPPLPSTEMQPGQSLQTGRTSVSVDANGNLNATTFPGAQGPSAPPSFQDFMAGFAAGFSSAAGGWGGGMPGCGNGGGNPWLSGLDNGFNNGFDNGSSGCQAHGEMPGAGQGQGQAGPQGLRLEGGQIVLPNGKRVPFGNRGVIIEMPDGTQVAAGRNSDTDTKNCRWVTAGPGQEIPTDPPGKTALYKLDGAGNLIPMGTK